MTLRDALMVEPCEAAVNDCKRIQSTMFRSIGVRSGAPGANVGELKLWALVVPAGDGHSPVTQ